MFYKFNHEIISINSCYLPKPSTNRLSSRKNNSLSYYVPTSTTKYRQMTFFLRTTPDWNRLPVEVVTASTLDSFKSRLAHHL